MSVIRTVEWFAEDIRLLRRCLPDNLSSRLADRVRFVLQKGKIDEIMLRLHERKSSINTALLIAGRFDSFVAVMSFTNKLTRYGSQSNRPSNPG